MESTRADKLELYLYKIKNIIKQDTHRQIIYRGHSDYTWELRPSIIRSKPKPDRRKFETSDWQKYELELLSDFKKYSHAYLTQFPTSELEWMFIAREYNLNTRLLDWSLNPLKALFFSIHETGHQNDGCVWIYKVKDWTNDIKSLDKKLFDKIDHTYAFEPEHSNQRVVAQNGCFTISPFPKNVNDLSSIREIENASTQIIIPKDVKLRLRIELDYLGINYQSLFPELDGVAKYLNWKHTKATPIKKKILFIFEELLDKYFDRNVD